MCGEYAVLYNSEVIGSAKIRENGLYYKIRSSCRNVENKMLRMKILCGSDSVDLGLLIPEEGRFVLRKDLPRKCLTGGSIKFIVYSNADRSVPFSANMPASYLHLLEHSRLNIQAGKKCITFNENL